MKLIQIGYDLILKERGKAVNRDLNSMGFSLYSEVKYGGVFSKESVGRIKDISIQIDEDSGFGLWDFYKDATLSETFEKLYTDFSKVIQKYPKELIEESEIIKAENKVAVDEFYDKKQALDEALLALNTRVKENSAYILTEEDLALQNEVTPPEAYVPILEGANDWMKDQGIAYLEHLANAYFDSPDVFSIFILEEL